LLQMHSGSVAAADGIPELLPVKNPPAIRIGNTHCQQMLVSIAPLSTKPPVGQSGLVARAGWHQDPITRTATAIHAAMPHRCRFLSAR